jgi:hypothetical protein
MKSKITKKSVCVMFNYYYICKYILMVRTNRGRELKRNLMFRQVIKITEQGNSQMQTGSIKNQLK